MTIRASWAMFRDSIAKSIEFERRIRQASDSAYADRFGRYGTDGERAAFHRDYRRRVVAEASAAEKVRLAAFREQIELLEQESNRLRDELKDIVSRPPCTK